MSWLARSFANTLNLDDGEDCATAEDAAVEGVGFDWPARFTLASATQPEDRDVSVENGGLRSREGDAGYDPSENGDREYDVNQARGMKEDLSELGDSLKRHLWGVASFLAPPPTPPPPPRLSDHRSGFPDSGKEPDFSESNNGGFQVNEILEYRGDQHLELANISETEDTYNDIIDDAMGITEEVLAFARNIAHHPETWLDFPLLEEEEFDDFEISDTQYKHVLAIELLAPRLAALRIELCPVHMSEGYFWMVYFVLLHSRLNKHDAEVLSSPQLVQARIRWMQELQNQTKELHKSFKTREFSDSPHEYSPFDEDFDHKKTPFEFSMEQMSASHDIENHSETEAVNNTFLREIPQHEPEEKRFVAGSSNNALALDDTSDDDWVKDDSDLVGYTASSVVLNEEDISFSDLEDDLDSIMPIKYRTPSNEVNINSETS